MSDLRRERELDTSRTHGKLKHHLSVGLVKIGNNLVSFHFQFLAHLLEYWKTRQYLMSHCYKNELQKILMQGMKS